MPIHRTTKVVGSPNLPLVLLPPSMYYVQLSCLLHTRPVNYIFIMADPGCYKLLRDWLCNKGAHNWERIREKNNLSFNYYFLKHFKSKSINSGKPRGEGKWSVNINFPHLLLFHFFSLIYLNQITMLHHTKISYRSKNLNM